MEFDHEGSSVLTELTSNKAPGRQNPSSSPNDVDSVLPKEDRVSSSGECYLEEEQVSTSILHPLYFSELAISWWYAYRNFLRRHRIKLELADEFINQLLFWIPHHHHHDNGTYGLKNEQQLEHPGHPWREVLYGIFSLNRLCMHFSQVGDQVQNSYGTSLQHTGENPNINATSLRIALNVVHSLMPTLLELVPPFSSTGNPSLKIRRQTQLRYRLEQLKFLLRIYLLRSYWKQNTKNKAKLPLNDDNENNTASFLGILMDGGLYHAGQSPGLPIDAYVALERKQSYVGRRTGLKIDETKTRNDTVKQQQDQSLRSLVAGELLFILRPLFWAFAEDRHHPAMQVDEDVRENSSSKLLKAFLVTLAMDLASLGLLAPQRNSRNNPYSRAEWNRRKMKLFLYLLRSPCWSNVTSPALEKTSMLLKKVPLLGRLADACMWDWILYWKHPYVSEEG